jgi:hypothetical protein
VPAEPTAPPDDPGYELLEPDADARDLPLARPVRGAKLAWWVRGSLLAMAGAFAGVFAVAAWLNPYRPDGSARGMATHTQLGLPPCNMVELIGKPCPACGMTTSFSLLVHADPLASVRANWVGTLLAAFWLVLIPWGVVGAVTGRTPVVRPGESLVLWSVGAFVVLSFARWVVVLLTG